MKPRKDEGGGKEKQNGQYNTIPLNLSVSDRAGGHLVITEVLVSCTTWKGALAWLKPAVILFCLDYYSTRGNGGWNPC